jgi:outer membrane protein assembly factor BamA
MTSRLRVYRLIMRGLIATGLLAGPILGLAASGPACAQSAAQPQSTAAPAAPSAIKVEGNQRIEADSIRTYFHAGNGQHLEAGDLDAAL